MIDRGYTGKQQIDIPGTGLIDSESVPDFPVIAYVCF